ncbi:MAG: HAMP domain-containing protein [Chloroflexaceae bacterium]|nr:HAMP domain-containing protein [Chloroflexaceae bacterium]
MKWHRRLRWKLFLSHMVIGIISILILLTTASSLAGAGLVPNLFFSETTTVSTDGDMTGQTVLLDWSLLQRFEKLIQQSLLIASFAALEAALVASLFVSSRIIEPLQAISAVSRRLAQGFYHERTVIQSDDELAELSCSVNQLAEALEQTEQRRLALLADVAHELRTPLSTISGYMEGMIDGVVQPEEKTFQLVLNESVRLQGLIEDLMLLSRAEAGQIEIAPRSVDIRVVLSTISSQFQPQAAANQIKLGLIIPEGMPMVWADPDRLKQIMINLLTNAFRYTPAGGRVTIRVRPEEERAVISIEDTGIGIAPEHLSQLFERFYRVDKSRSRASGGNGIGLTIARHLVYAQNGEIWAESDGPGRGARFLCTFPFDNGRSAEERMVRTMASHQPETTPSRSEQDLPPAAMSGWLPWSSRQQQDQQAPYSEHVRVVTGSLVNNEDRGSTYG